MTAGKGTIVITDANSVASYVKKIQSVVCNTTDGKEMSWTMGTANAQRASMGSIQAPPPAPTSIVRSPATMSLAPDATSQITASILPSGAVQTVTYASSNAAVATVSSSGLVTAIDAGSATITITSVAKNTVTATIVVTVA